MRHAPLFDTHCHLDHAKFRGEVDGVLARARSVGMWRMVSIGCARDPQTEWPGLELARTHDWIHTSAGVHPHDAEAFESSPEATCVAAIARDPHVVAIGETGLDYFYDHSPRALQQDLFRQQIAIARDVKKPLIIHTRNAQEDTLAILREENARDVGGIIHCFSEDGAFAKAALDMGFVASFSGIVTFKKARAIAEAAKVQPADAILVETDAPYLAPVPLRGKRNEPAYAAHTLDFIAALRGVDSATLRRQTSANGARLFGLPSPPEWFDNEIDTTTGEPTSTRGATESA